MLETISKRINFLLKEIEPSHKESISLKIFNLHGSARAALVLYTPLKTIYIERNEELQRTFYQDLVFFSILFGIDDNIISLSHGDEICDEGMRSLFVMNRDDYRHAVTNAGIFNVDFWTEEDLKSRIIKLRKGKIFNRLGLTESLIRIGYKKSPLVTGRGEFSLRNFILDVFPSTSQLPLRIEFFGDEVEIIKTFDLETQKAKEEIEGFDIFPARPPHRPSGEGVQRINQMIKDRVVYIGDFDSDIPEDVKMVSVLLSSYPLKAEGVDAGFLPLSGTGMPFNERDSFDEFPLRLKTYLKERKVILALRTSSQAMRVRDILFEHGIVAPVLSIEGVRDYRGNIVIIPQSPSSGFILDDTILITSRELFGEMVWARKREKAKIPRLLMSIEDLKEGDYVVHKKHGIGIYRGITRINIEDVIEDLMVIEYRGGDRLYVPPRNIHELCKFRAQEGVKPEIDILGGKTWERTKRRVKKGIEEMAHRLLRLYAEREVYKGVPLSMDTELHKEFDGFFEYEETPDQLKAIEEIKMDLESHRPMDRLLVGDVGYGKTEVAMRAAFKAVYDGKQVAVLVPTTILAEQHLRTFRERFSSFPVWIEALSSMRSLSERKRILEALKKGEVDIIIGTHSLLGKDVVLHNLGLLIIDEEHRFGVKDKERLRELKKGVHTLSMSATPIPRTLQMAFSGLRSMSIMETPPEERLAVKTEIYVFNENVIKNAIIYELQRDGQVFFVHNRIKDIMKIKDLIERIVPQARIGVAHGEMKRKELDHVMMDFLLKKINVLISTSIIGSGLDIPSANTIIINNAHEFGLSDLYQLRGRVGRSNVRAYAFLLIPGWDIIGEDARKRLRAISEMSYLGSGLRIAMTDLEIRGAGNLLGKEQSGHINAVGLDLYLEMLEKIIAELRGVKVEERPDVHLNIHVSAMIPDDYIEDINTRLSIYRRVGTVMNEGEIMEIREEVMERFGPIPDAMENLFKISRLRIICGELSIEAVIQRRDVFEIRYKNELVRSDLEKIPKSIRKQRSIVVNSLEERSVFIKIKEEDALTRLIDFLNDLRTIAARE